MGRGSSWILALILLQGAFSEQIRGSLGKTEFQLDWTTDYEEQSVTFTVDLSNSQLKWVGIGFSDHGKFNNSDLCVYDYDTLVDSYIDSQLQIKMDRSQDCELLKKSPTQFVFKRRLSTCDPRDYALEQGTTQVIISGSNMNTRDFGNKMVYKQLNYGKVIERRGHDILREPDAFSFAITADNHRVLPIVTSYNCIVKRIPEIVAGRVHHAIKMEAVVKKGMEHVVHHMEIFHCISAQSSEYEGPCDSPEKPKSAKSCSKVMAAWAMGEGPVHYPPVAGLPVGGPDAVPYIMVEIHYNNIHNTSGLVDSSGFKFTVTPSLRKYDAGIMELGLIYGDAMSIPPQQKAFTHIGYCVQDCTKRLPEEGINVFGSQLHSHLTGRKLWTSHYRKGVKIGELNRDNHYSPHWQHIQPIWPPINVHRGDVLATTCVYETMNRDKTTLGGYGTKDEMCVNYIYYYPASDVEVCKSNVDNGTLHRFFKSKGVSPATLPISTKYNSVEWNEENVADLAELFAVSPLNMHCLGHDGLPLPGHPRNWTALPHPRYLSGPFDKVPARVDCPAFND